MGFCGRAVTDLSPKSKISKLHKEMEMYGERCRKLGFYQEVIHMGNPCFIGKKELYTDLSTLSTKKASKRMVYIVYETNGCFVDK